MGVSASRVITSGDNLRTLQQALPVPMMFLPSLYSVKPFVFPLRDGWLIVEEESKMGILSSITTKSLEKADTESGLQIESVSQTYLFVQIPPKNISLI